MSRRSWSPNLHEAVIFIVLLRRRVFVTPPSVVSAAEGRFPDGLPVDQLARFAGFAVQERPGLFRVGEAPVMAADRGAAVDSGFGVPRDLIAGEGNFPVPHPLPARP